MQGFLDLPSELLLDILSQPELSPRDLYNISRTSRTLHYIALPLFLAQKGVEPNAQTIHLSPIWNLKLHTQRLFGPDALAGLVSSLQMKGASVQKLVCNFQNPPKLPNARAVGSVHVREDLRFGLVRIHNFIANLSSLEEVNLYLISGPTYGGRVAPDVLQAWTRDFHECLSTILEKGVKKLTVQFEPGADLKSFYSFAPIEPAPFSPIRGTVTNGRAETRLISITGGQWVPKTQELGIQYFPKPPRLGVKQRVCRLQHLSLHSTALLLPPSIQWTLDVLHSVKLIKSLSIAQITLDKEIWDAILPSIAEACGSRLTHLAILVDTYAIRMGTLFASLFRCPLLVKLRLGPMLSITQRDDKVMKSWAMPDLPHLEDVQATSKVLSHLLTERPIKWPAGKKLPLPKLRRVVVYHPPWIASGLTLSRSMDELDVLRERIIQTRPRNTAPVNFGMYVDEAYPWHDKISAYLAAESAGDTIDPSSDAFLPRYQHISEVITQSIDIGKRATPIRDAAPLFTKWLKLVFPDIRKMVFTCALPTLEDELTMMKEETIRVFLDECTLSLPQVEKVVVGRQCFEFNGGTWIENS